MARLDPVSREPVNGSWTREYINYILGGIIAFGLIGWGLDYLLHAHWIMIAGAVLGAGSGFYLAHQHRKAHASRQADE
ncbi:AtpZ/AtpI family protein [Zafaria sp. Z1313]|uniref:AtpZ/AtpI family protein n=1 Tax=unclassified Zafaria TaxID=2828765 RepID=UPI002E76B026|nr:AtpZ/AtpI family protein [Zafaria sp. J156]MEE1620850.1 AtpZ/AtpI family protein [Zafaria sp. J156]